jgi:signal transduction histidine kinase
MLRVLFCLMLPLWAGCGGGESVTVDALRLEAFEDATRMLRPEQVHLQRASLKGLDGERPNLGSSSSAWWIRVSGWQGAPRNARIVLDNPTLDSIDVFVLDGPRVLANATSGAALGREKDLIPTFEIPLNTAHELWFRVRSTKPVLLPFSLTRVDKAEVIRERRDLAVALYTGMVLAILIYNSFLAFSTGQRTYFSYIFVVLTVGLVQWGFNGYDRLLWGDVPWMAVNGLTVTGAFSGLSALMFARHFLEVRRYTPGWNRLIQILLGVYTAALGAALIGRPMLAYNLVNLGALSAPAMLILSIVSWRRGSPSAPWYFVAWLIFLVAVTMQALRDFGVLPSTQMTATFLPIGTVLEMLLLSFALGNRINQLKRSSDEANAKALAASLENERIVKEQNAELEARVRQRTEALAAANGELSAALEDLKGAQDQLIQTEKLASLGQMTAGIAHELNNPINYVQSNATSLNRDMEELIEIIEAHAAALAALAEGAPGAADMVERARDRARQLDLQFLMEESRQLIKGILEGADRTARIVGGLRVFGRMDGDELVEASLQDLLEASITVLGNRARSRARIEVNFEEGTPALWCQSGKLSQVFMNIVVNAVQATESRWPEAEDRLVSVQLTALSDGANAGEPTSLEIRIRDNGTGMDDTTRQRIFDPFYTTKDVGKGTGLGLSIVKGILDDHGAVIRVESALDKGTCFILTFPLHASGSKASKVA